jgi:Carboxypeptidase regulatory-like domain
VAGECVCSGLQGGDYELAVYPAPATRPFGSAGDAARDPIHVEPGADARVTLAIDAELTTISGTVVDDTGAPIADAFVTASTSSAPTNITFDAKPSPSARTDVTGVFTIDRLAPGAYNLRAHSADGGEVTAFGIAAGSTGVELRVARTGSISGDLIGFATAPEVAFHRNAITGGFSGDAVVDGTSFSVTGVAPGMYRLEAYDLANGQEADAASVVVTPGGTAHATLRERARGTVEATVVDAIAHTPVAGLACHVAAVAPSGTIGCCGWLNGGSISLSDVAGHVRLESPAGPVRVFCMPALQPPFPPDAPYSWATGDATVPVGGTGYAEVLAAARMYPRSDVGFYTDNFIAPPTIIAIDATGPAAASGLVVGDVILTIDGVPVAMMAPSAVMTLATNHRPGSLLAVGTARGTFTVVAGSTTLN